MPQHGSTYGYKFSGECDAIRMETEYSRETLNKLDNIQTGALNFIEDFLAWKGAEKFVLFEKECIFSFLNTLLKPQNIDMKVLNNLESGSYYGKTLFKKRSIVDYIKNPKAFFNDFYESSWKAGFLTYHKLKFLIF